MKLNNVDWSNAPLNAGPKGYCEKHQIKFAPGIKCPECLLAERAGSVVDVQGPEITATEVLRRNGASILEEAQHLTHGPRREAYGHPLDDYTRTAKMVSALLARKLKEPLTPHETALVMCCVKLSREMNAPKRDNMTDLAGYAWVAQECKDETLRRSNGHK